MMQRELIMLFCFSTPSWNNDRLQWSPYTKDNKLCLNVNDSGIKVEPYPNFERIKFWFDLIHERAKL